MYFISSKLEVPWDFYGGQKPSGLEIAKGVRPFASMIRWTMKSVRSGMTGAFDGGGGATDLINRNSPLFDHQIKHLQGRIFQCHPRATELRRDSYLVSLRV